MPANALEYFPIKFDGVTRDTRYSNLGGSIAFRIPSPLTLTEGSNHTIEGPLPPFTDTKFVIVKLYTYEMINNSPVYYYDLYDIAYVHSNVNAFPICSLRRLHVAATFASNIPKGTGFKITVPSYMSFSTLARGNCSQYYSAAGNSES